MKRLRSHDITLRGERVLLRPMTEEDWPVLLRWNSDPEVLYYSEGDDVQGYGLEEVQAIYHGVSRNAFCFLIEFAGAPIGECWLQRMNLERILLQFAGRDCRRIDLMIGEKEFWGRGLGTEVIRLLAQFGFERERADALFACDVADYNPRSRRAFEKAGFELFQTVAQAPGGKACFIYDLLLPREKYEKIYTGAGVTRVPGERQYY
jgi:aminoglycoside 6'-N-acetyltransferase